MPLVSIVMPVYNRERFVARAIESCLGQGFSDFELVVVDDGSRDASTDVVRRYTDRRVRLLVHERNRGVSPARNTGVDAALGEWVLFLDSDDELAADSLALIARRAREARPEIDRLAFNVRFDDGGISPEPPLVEGEWDFDAYARWSASLGSRTDFSNCIRRRTFERVRFADSRDLEAMYHLEFAATFRTLTCPEVVTIVHCDDANRLSNRSSAQLRRQAEDIARASRKMLDKFGPALRSASPERYAAELRGAATAHLLAGRRLAGVRYAWEAMAQRADPKMLATVLLGVAHPAALAAALEFRTWIARRRRALRARNAGQDQPAGAAVPGARERGSGHAIGPR